jgi:hypothetical protein
VEVVSYTFLSCLYRKPKQTAVISFVQCEMLIIDVSCDEGPQP